MKRVPSPGSMHDTGCLGLVHWDDPEGWNGEGGHKTLFWGPTFPTTSLSHSVPIPLRVTTGPKRPHRSVCPRPNIPLKGRQGSRVSIPDSPGGSGLAWRSQGFPRAAAPVGVFSRGTMRISGSLSCGAREVRSPCACPGGVWNGNPGSLSSLERNIRSWTHA